jgi:hypothetical protein
MALSTDTRTIGQNTYTVTQLAATPAYTLLTKLMKIIGPAFGALAGASEGKPVSEALKAALQELTSRLDEDEVKKIVNQLVATVIVHTDNGMNAPLPKVFESHFHGGNLSEFFQVLGFVLEVNYSDFFGGLESVKQKAASLVAGSVSKSPNTSGGMPGV